MMNPYDRPRKFISFTSSNLFHAIETKLILLASSSSRDESLAGVAVGADTCGRDEIGMSTRTEMICHHRQTYR